MSSARARPRTLRRRKPSLGARLRPFWILGVVLFAALAWGAVALARAPYFRIARVGVEVPLGSPVTPAQVRRAAAIALDANVWLVDTAAAARRIEAIPYVDRASVRRGQFPKPFVELTVAVRRPSGCVRAAQRTVTIDAASRVLQEGCAASGVLARIDAGRGTLPPPGGTIADGGIARLLEDARVLADANLGIAAVRRDRWDGLEAVDRSGVVLRFGEDADLARKAALVGPVRAGVGSRRAIAAIDLRAPATPTVEFR